MVDFTFKKTFFYETKKSQMLEISLAIISPLTSLLLLFWFKTDFVLEYGKVLGMRKILAIDRYEKALQFNPNLTYQIFVSTNYNSFFHRLINCTVCLATWIAIFSTCAAGFIIKDYLLLLTIPLSTITGLAIFLTIKKLI